MLLHCIFSNEKVLTGYAARAGLHFRKGGVILLANRIFILRRNEVHMSLEPFELMLIQFGLLVAASYAFAVFVYVKSPLTGRRS